MWTCKWVELIESSVEKLERTKDERCAKHEVAADAEGGFAETPKSVPLPEKGLVIQHIFGYLVIRLWWIRLWLNSHVPSFPLDENICWLLWCRAWRWNSLSFHGGWSERLALWPWSWLCGCFGQREVIRRGTVLLKCACVWVWSLHFIRSHHEKNVPRLSHWPQRLRDTWSRATPEKLPQT